MKTNKFLVIAVVVAFILSATAFYNTVGQSEDGLTAATPGSLLIEQYSPYVQQNGGIKSALPVETTSDVTVGGDVTVAGGAGALVLTTANTATSSATIGCINMNATSTASPGRIVFGSSGATTTYTGSLSSGVVVWQFGTCP